VVDSGAAFLLHDWFIALQQGKRQTSAKEFAKMKTLKKLHAPSCYKFHSPTATLIILSASNLIPSTFEFSSSI